MSILGIFIGLAGLILIFLVAWLMTLSIRQKRIEEQRLAKGEFRRRSLERERDEEHQERLLKAESGHIPTILFLAKESERFNVKDALYWYEKAAELDSETGMYGVVRLCKRTVGGDKVYEEKGRFWRRYIQGIEGDMGALCATGKAYLFGHGATIDIEKGVGLLEKAALANFIPAQLQLGDWHISKDNPSPKAEDSCFWFAKAAKLDSAEGMIRLGLNYLKGVGVQRDHRKACYWLERSGEKGNAEGMYHAGKAWIDHGKHGNAIAYVWLFCSAQCGYEPAKSVRDDIGNRLGVESVVLLQNFSKPLLKKIRSGVMGKHLLIRAFNKLYKRDVPIPNHSEFLDDEALLENSDALVKALKNQEEKEMTPPSVTADATDATALPDSPDPVPPPPPPVEKVSFEESTVKVKVKTDFTDKKMQ